MSGINENGAGGVSNDQVRQSAALTASLGAPWAANPNAAAQAAAWQSQYPTAGGALGLGIPADFEPALQAKVLAGEHPDGNILANGQPEMTTAFGPGETEAQFQSSLAADKELMTNWGNYLEAKNTGGFLNEVALMMSLGAITAGAGAVLAPAAGAAATVGEQAVAGAEVGAVSGVASSALTGQNIVKGALVGGALGGLGGAVKGFTPGLSTGIANETGVTPGVAKELVSTGLGAATGSLAGKITGAGAGVGALTGAIGGAVAGSGAKESLAGEIGAPAAGVATGLATSELTGLAGSTLTSPTGKSGSTSTGGTAPGMATGSMGLSPGVAPIVAGVGMAAAASGTSGTDSSFLGDLGAGLSSSLGGQSLGTTIGGMAPYLAVGAIGLEQAKAGQAQDAKASQQQQALAKPAITESNTLLGNYNAGKINPTDQATSSTEIAQGQSIVQSAQGLSTIAQAAFSQYNSGKLNAADQITLDQNTAAQKQQVRQQLASAGITDSTILAGQDQQIENNAIVTKQNMLNNYFNTGNAAYNSWLTSTAQGQATIQKGMEFASNSLQTELTNSMAEANIGIGEVNTAIQTQMTTDANYAAQVSQLMGTLATAYAKSVAGQAGTNGGGGNSNVGSAAGGGLLSAAASKAIAGGGATGNTAGVSDTATIGANDNASLPADIALETSGSTLGDPFSSGDILGGVTNPGYDDLGLDVGGP